MHAVSNDQGKQRPACIDDSAYPAREPIRLLCGCKLQAVG